MANNNKLKLNKKTCQNALMMILIGAILYFIFRDKSEGMLGSRIHELVLKKYEKMGVEGIDQKIIDSEWRLNRLEGLLGGLQETVSNREPSTAEKRKLNKWDKRINQLNDEITRLNSFKRILEEKSAKSSKSVQLVTSGDFAPEAVALASGTQQLVPTLASGPTLTSGTQQLVQAL